MSSKPNTITLRSGVTIENARILVLASSGFGKPSTISVSISTKYVFDLKDDEKFEDYMHDYDLLIIPGGVKALEKLRQEESALDFIREWDALGKTIGSICHGGQMLISAEIVTGRDVSGYYSIKDDLVNAGGNYVDAEAVVSDNLICCPHYKWMGQWMAKVIEINNAV